jgi:hypothetical protein
VGPGMALQPREGSGAGIDSERPAARQVRVYRSGVQASWHVPVTTAPSGATIVPSASNVSPSGIVQSLNMGPAVHAPGCGTYESTAASAGHRHDDRSPVGSSDGLWASDEPPAPLDTDASNEMVTPTPPGWGHPQTAESTPKTNSGQVMPQRRSAAQIAVSGHEKLPNPPQAKPGTAHVVPSAGSATGHTPIAAPSAGVVRSSPPSDDASP